MTPRRVPGAVVAALLVLALTSGCELGEDDEMVAPTRTITASPTSTTTPAPTRVPVGEARVSANDVVWAQGNTLHVGRRTVDLSPVGVDAFVVVTGGAYVLSGDELWFTDLARLRGTGLTGVTSLGVTATGDRVLVGVGEGDAAASYAFDTGTGDAVSADGLRSVTPQERREGPDRSGTPVPAGFELAGWAGATTFYGTTARAGRTVAVVSCDTTSDRCSTLAAVDGAEPVVFGDGRPADR